MSEIKCVIFTTDKKDFFALKDELPYKITNSFPFINAYGASVSLCEISKLKHNKLIRAVSSHTTVKTCSNNNNIYYPHQNPELTPYYEKNNFGQGISVAVIDTGICPHVDFLMPRNRLIFHDFIDRIKTPYDDNGHGTAVASIIASNGLTSSKKFQGIAPRANIIALKAISNNGEGGAFKILEAMQWIYQNRKKNNIRVVCMSFGAEAVTDGVDPLAEGASALWKAGITVIASAGNSGSGEKTITSPGISNDIITVGGACRNDKGENHPCEFSSRGPVGKFTKPDIIAHAKNIATLDCKGDCSFQTGTSMSAPIVASACVLMLQKNPKLTPNRVKELLLINAKSLPYSKNEVGHGLLSLDFIEDI
ncbi:MAG: S8 family peptidase [Firmicutes bacterium]|nr:S8 family peptidase [Bacillota bacterium]